jgi:hypothetical protein
MLIVTRVYHILVKVLQVTIAMKVAFQDKHVQQKVDKMQLISLWNKRIGIGRITLFNKGK